MLVDTHLNNRFQVESKNFLSEQKTLILSSRQVVTPELEAQVSNLILPFTFKSRMYRRKRLTTM